MKISKPQRSNIILLVFILLLIIPQTRQPIQVFLNRGLTLFSPSVVERENQKVVTNYDWNLVDENGKHFDFNQAKGQVVVLNFWATWCPPCIAEMPSLEKLYQSYKDDVVFLFVSNEKQEIISKFKEKNDYDFLVYAALTENPELFDTASIPRTYIIDREGHIVIDKGGAADWNSSTVREVLDNLLKFK